MKKIRVLTVLFGLGMLSAHGEVLSSWTFEEGSGSNTVDVVGSNDMTLTNGVSFSNTDPGAGAYSMSFDGVDGYLTTPATAPDLNPGTVDFTISFKVKIDVRQQMFILNKRTDANEFIAVEISSASGYLTLNVKDLNGGIGLTKVFSQMQLVAGNWYDVEIKVPRNAPAEIWIDGANNTHSDYNDVVFGGDLSIAAPLDIGRWSGDGYYFDGALDDVSISVIPKGTVISIR